MTTRACCGRVILVGAGPGDPELITVKGRRALRSAEVVVHDRLIGRELLDLPDPGCERIDVGKAPGRHAYTQDAINALLIDRAHRGRRVIRLKGGDPFVFGRGGEEALACAAAGVPWEIVPGVSSANVAAALEGIPLTHRGVASSYAVVAGRLASGAVHDWSAFSGIDTLVVLMGVASLRHVVRGLLGAGRKIDTPVAIIERATWPEQRIVEATLGEVEDAARAARVRAPAVIVIGDVVRLRAALLGQFLDPSAIAL